MAKIRVAIGILGADQSAFIARTIKRATKGYHQQCATGNEMIERLISWSEKDEIERVDIFGHGYKCGVIGKDHNWEGLFISGAKTAPNAGDPGASACYVKPGLGGARTAVLGEAIRSPRKLK